MDDLARRQRPVRCPILLVAILRCICFLIGKRIGTFARWSFQAISDEAGLCVVCAAGVDAGGCSRLSEEFNGRVCSGTGAID